MGNAGEGFAAWYRCPMQRRHQFFDLANPNHVTDVVGLWVTGYRLEAACARDGIAQGFDLFFAKTADAAAAMPTERTDVLRIGRVELGIAATSNATTAPVLAPNEPGGAPFGPLSYEQAMQAWLAPGPVWRVHHAKGPAMVLAISMREG